MKRIALLMLGVLALAGCAGEETEVGEASFVGAGASFVTVGIPYEKIWNAAEASFSPEFVVTERNRLKGSIKARKGAKGNAKEEIVGVYIMPIHSGSFRVKATMHKYPMRGKQRDWPQELIDRMQARLNTR